MKKPGITPRFSAILAALAGVVGGVLIPARVNVPGIGKAPGKLVPGAAALYEKYNHS
jgi:hypothetical protein